MCMAYEDNLMDVVNRLLIQMIMICSSHVLLKVMNVCLIKMNDYNENVLQFVFDHNRTPFILGDQMAQCLEPWNAC